MFKKENAVNLEELRSLTISVLLWKKRNLRRGYKMVNKLRDYIKDCDTVIEGLTQLADIEWAKDIVDMERAYKLQLDIERTTIKKERTTKKLEELKAELARLEDETYEVITRNGQLLTRDDMVQLTGGHYYNFDKADEDADADGTFLDYVFVHGVERVYTRAEDDLSFDLKLDMPLFHACMKAIIRKDKDHTVFFGALGMLQERQEEKRIEELESKYEVDGKIITLK